MLDIVQHASFLMLFLWDVVSRFKRQERAPQLMMTCVCWSSPVTMFPTVRSAGTRTAAEGCLNQHVKLCVSHSMHHRTNANSILDDFPCISHGLMQAARNGQVLVSQLFADVHPILTKKKPLVCLIIKLHSNPKSKLQAACNSWSSTTCVFSQILSVTLHGKQVDST